MVLPDDPLQKTKRCKGACPSEPAAGPSRPPGGAPGQIQPPRPRLGPTRIPPAGAARAADTPPPPRPAPGWRQTPPPPGPRVWRLWDYSPGPAPSGHLYSRDSGRSLRCKPKPVVIQGADCDDLFHPGLTPPFPAPSGRCLLPRASRSRCTCCHMPPPGLFR